MKWKAGVIIGGVILIAVVVWLLGRDGSSPGFETQKYHNELYGFTLNYPADWSAIRGVGEGAGENLDFVAFGPPDDVGVGRPLVAINIYPGMSSLGDMGDHLGFFATFGGEAVDATVAGVDAIEINGLVTEAGRQFNVSFFVNDGIGYSFGSTGFSLGEETVAIARAMMGSLRFID